MIQRQYNMGGRVHRVEEVGVITARKPFVSREEGRCERDYCGWVGGQTHEYEQGKEKGRFSPRKRREWGVNIGTGWNTSTADQCQTC
jgi:hypothetical protein